MAHYSFHSGDLFFFVGEGWRLEGGRGQEMCRTEVHDMKFTKNQLKKNSAEILKMSPEAEEQTWL